LNFIGSPGQWGNEDFEDKCKYRASATGISPGAARPAGPRMNLRFVEAFYWVASLKSVTRAA
jgi:hypothetical protein